VIENDAILPVAELIAELHLLVVMYILDTLKSDSTSASTFAPVLNSTDHVVVFVVIAPWPDDDVV